MADARSACHTKTSRNTSAVAAVKPASTNSCQGWNSEDATGPEAGLAAGPALCSVEVSELIVKAFVQLGIDGVGPACRSQPRLARPAHGDDADGAKAGDADDVGQNPRETVESLVNRRHQ